MAEVVFEKVVKIYDKKVKAVNELSFTCNNGEFFAILGPSGCGKSSSLRMLAGLEEISDGEVRIEGRRVNELSSRERNVAMSFENYGLYPDFTIYDNIAYPLKIHKESPEKIKEKVMDIAKKLRLTNVLYVKPAALSSGQKQRVSIARALVRNPDVTIMDEPLSHLDARMRSNMRSVIRHLHEKLGLTTVYVTHDQIEAMTMADKILIMNNGERQQVGTPDEVYYYPANVFVAGFIGTPQMNLVPCTIRRAGKETTIVEKGAFEVKTERYADSLDDGKSVIYGFRPHDLEVSREETDGFFKGTVYVTEPLGETTIVSIKAGDIILKAELEGNVYDLVQDQEIYFGIDDKKSHLFDAATEMRIIPGDE